MFSEYPEGGVKKNASSALHVKHQFPQISGGPPIGATIDDETYGLLYNEPETEAEIEMHELWLAKRKQEVMKYFNYMHMFIFSYHYILFSILILFLFS